MTFLRNVVVCIVSACTCVGMNHAYAQDDYDSPFTQGNMQPFPVYLEADEVFADQAKNTVVAKGNVRITYDGRVLKASEIIYNLDTNRIKANGLITVIDPDGTTFQATDAELDEELNTGLILGAQALLSNGSRVAAVSAERRDGNKTLLSKAVYSPCEVCEESPDPLWQVRAGQMVHDEEARDYVYKDVYFDVFGYPVAYLPYFRHPDETVERRSGFLPPTIGGGSSLGYYVQVPYFFDLAPNRDFTLAPIIATDESPVLAGEFRGIEKFGRYNLDGSLSYGDIDGKDQLRGHIFADGVFEVGNGWAVGFDINRASDDVYLRKYNITDIDRLNSRMFVERYTDSGFIQINSYAFQSFREDEFSGEIPLVLPEITAEERAAIPFIGGLGVASFNTVYLSRDRGRDVFRGSLTLDWDKTYVTQPGILFGTFAQVRGDVYHVQDTDATNPDNVYTRFAPMAGAEARYPFVRVDQTGASHILEPIAQFIIAPHDKNPDGVPNEDSLDVEFDEASLFSKNRFNGFDRWETGPRLNVGVGYEYVSPSDFSASAVLGQSYSLNQREEFSTTSGLRDTQSDYVGGWSLQASSALSLTHRFRLDPDFNLQRNEVYADATFWNLRMAGSYVFLEGEANADIDDDRSEANFLGAYTINSNWQVRTELRRDLEANSFIETLGGVNYQNECIEFDFSVSRRYNNTENAPSSTNFGLKVRLLTFAE